MTGMSLVGLACCSPLEGGIVEQVEYLVKKQKADVTLTDIAGNNAVSWFCTFSGKSTRLDLLLLTKKQCSHTGTNFDHCFCVFCSFITLLPTAYFQSVPSFSHAFSNFLPILTQVELLHANDRCIMM